MSLQLRHINLRKWMILPSIKKEKAMHSVAVTRFMALVGGNRWRGTKQ
jgi:hypothetical protein